MKLTTRTNIPWRRRAMALRRRGAHRVARFVSMCLEAVGELGEVWQPVRRHDFGVGQGRPVVLLHGFGAPRRILHVLERRLRNNLGVAVMSFHLPGLGGAFGKHSMEAEAARLSEKLERLCQRHNVKEFDIIGHSKGGLMARYLASSTPIGSRVRTVISLGSPFSGAPLALLGIFAIGAFSKTVWDLVPLSTFLRQMRKRKLPPHVRMVSVAGSLDTIAPAFLCRVPTDAGAPGMVHNYVINGVGHSSLLVSRRVFAIIQSELTRHRPPTVAEVRRIQSRFPPDEGLARKPGRSAG
ncbi:MAG: alpha/beta fold hydrolase [Myxococcota bacterium]